MGKISSSLDQLGKYEKFAIILCLIAYYGDGEFSDAEKLVLKKYLRDTDFSPPTLVHKDPSDFSLCLDEKVLWILNFLNDNFANQVLDDEDVEDLFKEVCNSLFKRGNQSSAELLEWHDFAGKTIKKIIKADGEISEKDKRLLKIFNESTGNTLAANLITFTVLVGLAYLMYRIVVWVL